MIEEYRSNPMFRKLVNSLEDLLIKEVVTVDQVKDACVLSISNYIVNTKMRSYYAGGKNE